MCEGEVGIHPWLIEEGKIPFRSEGEVGVRDIQLAGVKEMKGV